MHGLGSRGERTAARYLRRLGYRILATNWRSGRYEIDIVVEREGIVAFVEVKTRMPGPQSPAEAIDWRKRRHMARAAASWVATRSPRAREFRFDVVSISILAERTVRIEHIPDAFTADDA